MLLLRAHREQSEATAAEFGVSLTPDSLVISRFDGTPRAPDSFSHAVVRICRAAGYPGVTLQTLRHTHASILLARNVPLKVVSERLGHSSTALTADTYSHVLPTIQRAAALEFEEAIEDATANERSGP